MAILEYFYRALKLWENHSMFYFSLLETSVNHEPLWNPSMIDAQIPLFVPKCQVSGLIQQIKRYVETKAKSKTPIYVSR